jgi:hypothetical protein
MLLEHHRLIRSTPTLAAASLLAAGIFLLRLVDNNESDAVLLLLVLPIGLVTARFGLPAGVIASAASIALVFFWADIRQVDLAPLGYLIRAVVFVGFAAALTLQPLESRTLAKDSPGERLLTTRPAVGECSAEVVRLSTNVRATLRIEDGRAIVVPVPEGLRGRFEVGSSALVYFGPEGGLLGWYLPQAGLGVDMRAQPPPEAS